MSDQEKVQTVALSFCAAEGFGAAGARRLSGVRTGEVLALSGFINELAPKAYDDFGGKWLKNDLAPKIHVAFGIEALFLVFRFSGIQDHPIHIQKIQYSRAAKGAVHKRCVSLLREI